MSPAALLASARLPDGSLQCSASGVQSPTHARALLASMAEDADARAGELTRRWCRAEIEAGWLRERAAQLEGQLAALARQIGGR